jgi:HD superfamily phosphohydrolase
MSSSRLDGGDKMVVDAIHGQIHLNDLEVRVIDTPTFQRLRQLKQLAMAQMVYPTATHTRFAHSIGALGTMIRILDSAKQNGVKFTEEQRENLRLAALLHDVGHYPYSHLMEKLDKVKLIEEEVESVTPSRKAVEPTEATAYPEHEEISALIVTKQDDLIKALGNKDRAKDIADIFTGTGTADPQLSKFVHSSFDIDRWDYLLRDSQATGLPYGCIDIDYLLNNVRVSQEGMVGFADKALPAIEHFLLARFFMYRVVYYHKTIYGFEEACRQLLRRLRDRYPKYDIPRDKKAVEEWVVSEKLYIFTDAFVDKIIRDAVKHEGTGEWDETIRALARSIQGRKPPKLLKEVQVCEETKQQYHRGNRFIQNCKNKLKDLASEFEIPLGQFLLCQPKITVVKWPEEQTVSQVAKLKPEDIAARVSKEEEEDIKIFHGDEEEPSSLMDVEHSLVVKYAKYSLQIFRLYVVYDDKDAKQKISRLRERIKEWHEA